jgi:hypothetical protein
LERDKDELRAVLDEIGASTAIGEIVKSRATELYTTIIGLPMSKAMQILRLNRSEKLERLQANGYGGEEDEKTARVVGDDSESEDGKKD